MSFLSAARRLLLVVVAALITRAVLVRLRAMRSVAADLRTPALFVPLAPTSATHVRVVRRLMSRGVSFPTPDGVTIDSVAAAVAGRDPVRVLTIERPDRPRPSAALLWIHGGGTVIGQPEQSIEICGRWAAELDLLVVSVDYRLAPEHPYPDGLEDCYTALCWLTHHAARLGVDLERIVVGGDSAGGLLAAALSLLDRDRGLHAVSFQLLEYPMLDDRTTERDDVARERSFVWSPRASRFGWAAYLSGLPSGEVPPHAAPARMDDLAGSAPAWIGVGDLDLLHDEAVEYAARLQAAGVECDLHVQPGMYHGADAIRRTAPTSMAFRDAMTAALAAAIAPGREHRSPRARTQDQPDGSATRNSSA